MSYEAWRINYQSSEQAARAAYMEAMQWKMAFASAREADYLREGMAIEQARIHAETDIAMAVAMMSRASPRKDGERVVVDSPDGPR